MHHGTSCFGWMYQQKNSTIRALKEDPLSMNGVWLMPDDVPFEDMKFILLRVLESTPTYLYAAGWLGGP